MCGIWSLLSNKNVSVDFFVKLLESFEKIKGRGPDYSTLVKFGEKSVVGFHRLSIVGLNELGNQPFYHEDSEYKYCLVCNGEIYNHQELAKELKLKVTSDCEVILPLFIKYGITKAVNKLDGVFAFNIYMYNKKTDVTNIIACRDRIGVRPLFYGFIDNMITFSSEVKGLSDFCDKVNVFTPGTIMKVSNEDIMKIESETYYSGTYCDKVFGTEEELMSIIRSKFEKAIRKRLMSDRPIGALLSGGLDSSLSAALTAKLLKNRQGFYHKLKTFSIGMKGGTDTKYAKMVAKKIDSEHHSIEFEKKDFLNAIRDTIWATESYDITTVRASVGQYLVSKYISTKTNIKVVISGDGSDEVCSGYIYNYNAPSGKELHNEAEKRLKEIHLYDGLRADRATSINGLELRVPFLDIEFVKFYMSLSPELRQPNKEHMEKYFLRKAYDNEDLLPQEVLWRKKEAFSDGVSSVEDSWHVTLKNYINTLVSDEEYQLKKENYTHCAPTSKEAYYYRKVFGELFGEKFNNVIPEFWLPNWSEGLTEPSARALNAYSSSDTCNQIENKYEENIQVDQVD